MDFYADRVGARPEADGPQTFCVIPTFKARATICEVVRQALRYAHAVIVVDDACPQHSGEAVEAEYGGRPSVVVIRHEVNRGVGGATKTGFARALELGAEIIIKLDADGQMDARYIPSIVALFETDPAVEFVKGNRFIDMNLVRAMPKRRLFGNSVLSLLLKLSSGYWNLIDPTNGYLAFRASKLRQMAWHELSDRYFFEGHVLCMLGMKKARIAEMEMPAIYGGEQSSLSIMKVVFEFPPKLAKLCLKRVLFQYFIYDVNLGSLYICFGALLVTAGTLFGTYQWVESIVTGVPRTTGTVMVAVLALLMGFQLLLNALMHDVQFSARSLKVVPQPEQHPAEREQVHAGATAPSRSAAAGFERIE
jgi:glycosyltransferase involved in cell wall biosynthesis